jgi:hypothetical protein
VHDPDNFVQKLRNLGFQCFSDIDEGVDADNQEDRVDSVSWNHNLETAIARRNILTDDHGSQLAKGHLKQISNPENGFLKLHGLQLIWILLFILCLHFVEARRLGLLQGIVGQGLDDRDHFRDWSDHDLLRIVLEEQGAGREDDASEDCGKEL